MLKTFQSTTLAILQDFYNAPKFKAMFAFGFALYLIALFALLRGNVYYIDDWKRSIAESNYNDFSRFVATALMNIFSFFGGILDISPLYQIIAIALLALSSMVILYAFEALCEKKVFNYFGILATLPLGLSPYFLENLSYRFDAISMCFALLCACVPFLFIKHKVIFCAISFIALVLLFCSYQAANSVYILLALFLAFNGVILGKMNILNAGKFLCCSGGILIASALFYKFFIVVEKYYNDYDYISGAMMSFKKLLRGGGFGNLRQYLEILYADFVGVGAFFMLICVGAVIFIIAVLKVAGRKKIVFFITSLFLALCLCASYGLYLVLEKPLFAPRAFNGIGALVALMFLSTILLAKARILSICARFCVIILAYTCIAFANAYGNAITKQQEYTFFRTNLILSDLLQLKVPSKNTAIFIKGSIGYAPAAKFLIQNHSVARRIIPVLLREGWMWNQGVFWHLKSPYTIITEYEIPAQEKQKMLLENDYHIISQIGSCVIIELKSRD